MVAIPYKVYVVVDRNFGAQLNKLERGVPVWIVESPDNKPVAETNTVRSICPPVVWELTIRLCAGANREASPSVSDSAEN